MSCEACQVLCLGRQIGMCLQKPRASGLFVCHNSSSRLPSCSSRFTLHGLWPNYEKGHCPGRKGAWPQNCDDSSTDLPPECDCPFDLSLLSDLESSMLQNWPSYGQANAGFWKHEWDKHGRQGAFVLHACSSNTFVTPLSQVETALGAPVGIACYTSYVNQNM